MFKADVNIDPLLAWAKRLGKLPKRTPYAAARALNQYGETIIKRAAQQIARQSGLDPSVVEDGIKVKKATASDLSWSLDASELVLAGDMAWQRPWDTRDDSDIDKDRLVQIIAHQDCCEVCAEIVADNPYTVGQVQTMAQKWKDYVPKHTPPGERSNLIHPNCRCAVTAWSNNRAQVPVVFGGGNATEAAVFTREELAVVVANELRIELAAI